MYRMNGYALAVAYAGALFRKGLVRQQMQKEQIKIRESLPPAAAESAVRKYRLVKRYRKNTPANLAGKTGVVYVVEVEPGVYKIGCSSDLGMRIRGLNCGRVKKVVLIHSIPTAEPFQAEQALHEVLSVYRVVNELFRLDDATLEKLRRITYLGSDAREALRAHLK